MIGVKYLLIGLCCFLMACGSTPAKEKKKSNDKEAAKMNVQLASGYMQRGQLEIARDKLAKAIEQDPNYSPGFATMALLMEMVNEPDKAEDYYEDALEIDPRNPDLHNNYGQFLCKQKKFEEAIEHFDAAIKNQFYETPEKTYANLGYCLMQGDKPDYKKAEMNLRKAIKIDPQMPSALITMGDLGIRTKQYLMARAYMQRYHAVAQQSAYSLWLQLQAEKALGDNKHYMSLSRELLRSFPDSPEADLLTGRTKK
jgi:type IV pilus assembly protein PilF